MFGVLLVCSSGKQNHWKALLRLEGIKQLMDIWECLHFVVIYIRYQTLLNCVILVRIQSSFLLAAVIFFRMLCASLEVGHPIPIPKSVFILCKPRSRHKHSKVIFPKTLTLFTLCAILLLLQRTRLLVDFPVRFLTSP